MTIQPLYQVLASLETARRNCLRSVDAFQPPHSMRAHWTEMAQTHGAHITELVRKHLPSGSGFDSGTQFNFDKSGENVLRFNTAFHHMNEAGYYDEWTNHLVTLRPSFVHDFECTISGENRNDIKDYIEETFRHALATKIDSKTLTEVA